MEPRAIILTYFLSLVTLNVDALTCLSCDRISHPRFCHVVAHCGPSEVCYAKSITTGDHTNAFELGCTNPALNNYGCNSSLVGIGGQGCSECCNTDLCNSELCGQRGYPKERGPICLSCNSRVRGEPCNFIDFCEKEEVCSVDQRIEFGEVVYTNQCSNKHVCEGHLQQFVGKRTIPVCHACCTSDLCNVNCTYHAHTEYCLSDSCKNGGTCVNETYGYKCLCTQGFGGRNCDPDPCQSSPCKNGGGCMTVDSGYVCVCPSGYLGKHCDIDMCQSGPCSNGATCSMISGSYSCACLPGYLGPHCEIEICNPLTCVNNGTCSVSGSSFQCTCPVGYTGLHCEQHSATTPDPCLPSPCLNNGVCIASGNTYACTCQTGYSGQRCEIDSRPLDPCSNVTCLNAGTCSVYNATAFVCKCPQGIGGKYCEINPCATANCSNGGGCLGLGVNGYVCMCLPGYSGLHCEFDACTSGPCQNGGNCSVVIGNFSCSCTADFHGDLCEHPRSPCDNNQCKNGATCLVAGTSYYCACPANYQGHFCEIDPCQQDPCSNGGTCNLLSDGYTCTCPIAFTGKHCELVHCHAGLCKNGGICFNTADSYKCMCTHDFSGQTCETTTGCPSDPGAANTNMVHPLFLPESDRVIQALCDVKTGGGRWIILQRRFNGSESFYRNLSDYEFGFGNPQGEFWLGLNYTYELMRLCNASDWELRIDLVDADGVPGHDLFQTFNIGPPPNYHLTLGAVSGNASRYSTPDHGFMYHNNTNFSTYDHDTTKSNCPTQDHSGWWYRNCSYVNLNGKYMHPPGSVATDGHGGESGMIYYSFDTMRSLVESTMKIRPKTPC